MKKKRLGRGLGALIGDINSVSEVGVIELDIDQIQRSRFQPRQYFDAQALRELADSILAQGVVQPLIVRPEGERYELIAGERRWRAAQLAGLRSVPVIVRDFDGRSAAAVALIENIQREDLNPIEESQAFMRLIDEFDLTHEQVANSVGRSRASVTNLLRLLDLTDSVKQQVNSGLLSMGHARALLALMPRDQARIANIVIKRSLSVREIEVLVRQMLQGKVQKNTGVSKDVDPDTQKLQDDMSEKLGAAVKIKTTKNGAGQLIIHFHNSDELAGILKHLTR